MSTSVLGTRRRAAVNVWPGWVDALASLLMVVIFVLMVFMVAQFTLSNALSGKDAALEKLTRQISELAELLSLEQLTNEELRADSASLSAQLKSSLAEREDLSRKVESLTKERNSLSFNLKSLQLSFDDLNTESQALTAQLGEALEKVMARDEKLTELTQGRNRLSDRLGTAELEIGKHLKELALLNQQIVELRKQLAIIEKALDIKERENEEQRTHIADLGKRLNVALAGKVEELKKYRSEFFEQLSEILSERKNVAIKGDRFVLQSELLFTSGSAELAQSGKEKMSVLAAELTEIMAQLPQDIDWVLRIDGHTDIVPISEGSRYESNWDLSTARALAVVKFLITQGVPADRLAASGFGEFHPLAYGDSPEALAKNRRIEFIFDQK